MLDVNMNVAKGWFFKTDRVKALVSEGQRKALSEAGAFVMKTARGFIRTDKTKKQNPSKPGRPPKSRTGLLRDKIIFAYDPVKKSVVIGPTKLNSTRVSLDDGDSMPTSGQPVTSVLEHGGSVKTKEIRVPVQAKRKQIKTEWVRHRERIKAAFPNAQTRTRQQTIAKRPYMLPALLKNRDKITRELVKSIKQSFRKGV